VCEETKSDGSSLGLVAALLGVIGLLAAKGWHTPTWVSLAIIALQCAFLFRAGIMMRMDTKRN